MKIKKQLVLRKISNDYILVPTGNTVLENNGLFSLSEVSAFIWEKLVVGDDEEALLHAVLDEFDIDEKTARTDLREFLCKLKELGII